MHTFNVPIARSKSAALMRVLDLVPRNYTLFTCGMVRADKLLGLLQKFDERHAIGATPSQRITRKKHGKANAALVVYFPEQQHLGEFDAEQQAKVHWLLLFTQGELQAHEKLQPVMDKKHGLQWLGYELTRYSTQGAARYTWRRPRDEMENLYNALDEALKRRRWSAVSQLLDLIAAQPGFHGVREQGIRLQQFVRSSGYDHEMPRLFYLEKMSHGEKLEVAVPKRERLARNNGETGPNAG